MYVVIVAVKHRIELADNALITTRINIKRKVDTITSITVCAISSRKDIIPCYIVTLLTAEVIFLKHNSFGFG